MTITATYPKPALLTILPFDAYQETSSIESNKRTCTVQEAAERHLCLCDLYGFRQENNAGIYIHPHPQSSTYRVTLTKLRQILRNKKKQEI
jgi:hypothetical protein